MAGADGMGYPSSTAPVANAPWSMQPQQQQQQQQQQEQLPSCIPQAYPQDPQSLELVQQYTMGQGSAYGYGTTDPQQHAYPPPPDLLGEPGAPEAYSLGGAAQCMCAHACVCVCVRVCAFATALPAMRERLAQIMAFENERGACTARPQADQLCLIMLAG
eukprot:1161608-Pelagomonas_calceolata.AAC.2